MPRFFFDIGDDEGLARDEVGLDLPDLGRAKAEAVVTLPAIAREAAVGSDNWQITSSVRDEMGDVVFEASLTFHARHYV